MKKLENYFIASLVIVCMFIACNLTLVIWTIAIEANLTADPTLFSTGVFTNKVALTVTALSLTWNIISFIFIYKGLIHLKSLERTYIENLNKKLIIASAIINFIWGLFIIPILILFLVTNPKNLQKNSRFVRIKRYN